MAQGRSTKTISMIEWIRTSRMSTKISLSETSEQVSDPVMVQVTQQRHPRAHARPGRLRHLVVRRAPPLGFRV